MNFDFLMPGKILSKSLKAFHLCDKKLSHFIMKNKFSCKKQSIRVQVDNGVTAKKAYWKDNYM